jgi:hypothetical protein
MPSRQVPLAERVALTLERHAKELCERVSVELCTVDEVLSCAHRFLHAFADSLGSAAPSRVGSAVDLSDVSAEPPAQSTTKKKASPEEVKAATARVAAAGAALKEAMAAAAAAGLDAASDGAVIAAQAAMNEAKEAKSILMMGGSRKM